MNKSIGKAERRKSSDSISSSRFFKLTLNAMLLILQLHKENSILSSSLTLLTAQKIKKHPFILISIILEESPIITFTQ